MTYQGKPLSVSRALSAERLNRVVNHPEVRRWVSPGANDLDLTPVVADPANVLLLNDLGGCLFERVGAGIYEVHVQFLPEGRGQVALQAVQDALLWMFTRTDAFEIQTKVPDDNTAALTLAKAIGGDFQFHRDKAWQTDAGLVGVKYFALTINSWAGKCDGVLPAGRWFHDKLEMAKALKGSESPVHDDDDAHDRYVGATVEMVLNGQLEKALWFYNRWARQAGYAAVSLIAENPPVIDIQDAILAIRPNDMEVLLCR